MGKDAQYIRVGLQQGIFKFGKAVKMNNSSEYSYYCSDRQVWEEIGYFNKKPSNDEKKSKEKSPYPNG